jgi:hypothetical protein
MWNGEERQKKKRLEREKRNKKRSDMIQLENTKKRWKKKKES